MRFVITGCGGFTGYSLAKKLLKEGHLVVGVDNFSADHGTNIVKDRVSLLSVDKNFEFVEADITDIDANAFILKFRPIDYFINLAKKEDYYSFNEADKFSEYIKVNVWGCIKMYELALSLGVKKFIAASASGVYGGTKKIKLTEKKVLPKPLTPVSSSFYANEQILQYLSQKHKLPTFVFRFSTIYGPMMRPHTILTHFIDRVERNLPIGMYSDIRTTTRDFIYIDDIVEYIYRSLNKRIKFQVMNIASGKTLSLYDVLVLVANKFSRPIESLDITQSQKYSEKHTFKTTLLDISRSRKILGYLPQTSIEEGISKTVEWYKHNLEILRRSAP